jgi:hypothetical protein
MPIAVAVPVGRLNHRRARIRLCRIGIGDSCTDAEGGRTDDSGDRDTANQSLEIHRMTPSKSITNSGDSKLPRIPGFSGRWHASSRLAPKRHPQLAGIRLRELGGYRRQSGGWVTQSGISPSWLVVDHVGDSQLAAMDGLLSAMPARPQAAVRYTRTGVDVMVIQPGQRLSLCVLAAFRAAQAVVFTFEAADSGIGS